MKKTDRRILNPDVLMQILTLFMLLFVPAYVFAAEKSGPPEDAAQCMSCHSDQKLSAVFSNNEKISATVREADLGRSVHNNLRCADCHQEISMDNHPAKKFDSKEAFVIKVSGACRGCHTDDKLTARPNHAFVINSTAPRCIECHSFHAVKKAAALKSSLKGNNYCLFCHRLKISKSHANGEELSLLIDPSNLPASVHNRHSCSDCHMEFSQNSHPQKTFATGREHSIALSEACKKCHEDKASQVRGSIHYNLSFPVGEIIINRGNPGAPLCTDCHGFHTVGPKDSYETLSGQPCRKCHDAIFSIYEKSVHGMARARGEHKAPLCSSCHFAHEVSFTAMTDRMKGACLGCHKDAAVLHRKWLPNADLHLSVIACAACHAPASGKGIYLQFVDRNTGAPISEEQIVNILGTDSSVLSQRLNAHGEGIDSWELSYILKQLNDKGAEANVTYIGKMDVNRYSEAHQLSIKKNAVRECESCHRKDSAFLKNVTLAIIRADGRVTRYAAQPGVLGSLGAVGTISRFYVLGGTRLKILDVIGLLIILCGIMFPVAHISLRALTLRLRKTKKADVVEASKKIYLHPLPVRLWHWLNVLCFAVLIITGLQIRYREVASLTTFRTAVNVHNIFGFILVLDFFLWFVYYMFTGKIRLYIPPLNPVKYITGCVAQAKYYGYGIFFGEANPHHASPENKFNPLQQTAYFFIMLLLLPLQIITGGLLWDVKLANTVINMLGGIGLVDIVHVALSFAFFSFLFVHIYLTTLGPTLMGHIKAMFTGYEEEK